MKMYDYYYDDEESVGVWDDKCDHRKRYWWLYGDITTLNPCQCSYTHSVSVESQNILLLNLGSRLHYWFCSSLNLLRLPLFHLCFPDTSYSLFHYSSLIPTFTITHSSTHHFPLSTSLFFLLLLFPTHSIHISFCFLTYKVFSSNSLFNNTLLNELLHYSCCYYPFQYLFNFLLLLSLNLLFLFFLFLLINNFLSINLLPLHL
jgi:hypothetical protein